MMEKALEAAARALCRQAGNPENTKFEGRPMWMSYLPEARAAIEAALPDLMVSVVGLMPAEDRPKMLKGMAAQAGNPLEQLTRMHADCEHRLEAAEARGDERNVVELKQLLEEMGQLIGKHHSSKGGLSN